VALAVAGCTGASSIVAGPTSSSPPPETVTSSLVCEEDGRQATYQGEAGRTALEILQKVDPDVSVTGSGESAFVTRICGYSASESAQEFWALYVNGQIADVGAGSLATEDGDVVTWKIETF
jgi:hypothetical protein